MLQKERKEIDLLLGNEEVILTTYILGFRKNWRLGNMHLAKMAKLSKIYSQIEVNQENLDNEDLSIQYSELNQSMLHNSSLAGDILATAFDTRLPKWFVKWHLMRNVDSIKFQEVVNTVLKESNLANFTIPIILLQTTRMTKPKIVAEQPKA